MGKYPNGPTLCSEDSSCHVLIHSLKDWGPVLVFAFWGYTIVTCTLFQLTRRIQQVKKKLEPVILKEGTSIIEAKFDIKPSDERHKFSSKEKRIDMDIQELQVTGYLHTAFGEFCYTLCCLVCVHWIALFVLILFDTYNQCQVGGIDNLCFYGNHVIFGTYDFNAMVSSTILYGLCLFTCHILADGVSC